MQRAINWLLIPATLASAFALYAIKYDTRRLEAKLQAQERALERAENDVSILMAERAHMARPERLEPLARALGLVPMTGGQYLRVEPARSPSPLVGEGRGGRDSRTIDVGTPPTPNPSPRRVEDAPPARGGGEAPAR